MKLQILIVLFILVSCKEKPSLPDPLEAGWEGERICEVLFEDDTMRVLKCTFAPGIGHEMHYHPPHFGYTLKGSTFEITDHDGTRTVEVPTGTDFGNDAISEHQVLNVGDSIAVFLIVEPK